MVAVGGGTRGALGGPVDPGTRAVHAPAGVVTHEPAEMIVRVRAGTPVADLAAALAPALQFVAVPDRPGSTVGGALAVGASGVEALGWGPLRDSVLEVTFVTAEGALARAGGATVKNVAGYDLCRLLVGSLGTLGLLAEVVLRTRPVPPVRRWHRVEGVDPEVLRSRLHRPWSILWDGTTTWVLLAGHEADVDAEASAHGLVPTDGPPPLPPQRWSCPPSEVCAPGSAPAGRFVAEIGVGIVHCEQPQPPRALDPGVAALGVRLKAALDPTGRLAPGRSVGRR